MALVDTFTIPGGPNQSITDWYTGDDRIFNGVVNGLPAGDPNLSDAYFTLKLNPSDTDANAILQKHVTQVLSPAGQIVQSPPAAPLNTLVINVYSGDYEGLVQPSTIYSWDFRVITALTRRSYTVTNGTVAFNQQVTQTSAAGTLAALPNFGQPRFRGFIQANPQNLINPGTFNRGDIYFNQVPIPGGPIGWQCTQQGTPGTWVSFFSSTQTSPAGTFIPLTNWTFGTAPPVTLQHNVGDIVWNTSPTPGGNLGWICVTGGVPGLWEAFGFISQ